MCTALSYKSKFFGRTLDWMHSYGEEIVITPRNFTFAFYNAGVLSKHYAMVGTAVISQEFPLYFDAVNEKGLAAAGLNFPDNAYYYPECEGKINVASYELIPWVLGQCESIRQVKKLIDNVIITDKAFSKNMPAASLHWIFSDKQESITVEQTSVGLKIYNNEFGVLTNNPTFDYHKENIKNYLSVSAKVPKNNLSNRLDLKPYSYGMGALGLPGDFSSASRFVRAVFLKENSVEQDLEAENVWQFFHIMASLSQPQGCTQLDGHNEYTIYTSCCNLEKCIYYYRTYFGGSIKSVKLYNCDLNSTDLIAFEFVKEEKIIVQN